MSKSVTEQFDLTGKVGIVTGGTGWLGTAFAEALAECGATVVVGGRSSERCQASADALPTPQGQKHVGIELDQMSGEGCKAGFATAVEKAGQVDILVNNGLEATGKDLTETTYEEFARHQENNAAYFELARLLRNHVVERSASGSVINIGSMYGQVASYPDAYEGICAASPVAYHALKGGTIHMTRHLAAYYAKDNVRVNTISPGPFPNLEKVPGELAYRLCEKLPMARMGKPEELKGSLILLASEAGSYITGQNITVDGGWTAW